MKYLSLLLSLIPLLAFADWDSSDKKTPDETLYIYTSHGEMLKGYLWLPQNYDPAQDYSAVVLAHGCGGAHYKDIPSQWTDKYIAGKYKVWGKILSDNNMMVLLIDSFTTRDNDDVGQGVCDSSDPLARPAKIDPVSVRPADIAEAINYMKSRYDVVPEKVGVLGFSNGATSALVLANHGYLSEQAEDIYAAGKEWFDLPFVEEYQASMVVALYPGCGLNGYSEASQGIFDDHFETYTETYLFSASDDSSLPSDTPQKCMALRQADGSKDTLTTNMMWKTVPATGHGFDYKENDEPAVADVIERITALFKTM